MNPDLDTLATRLYVIIDDLLIEHPEWAPERPAVGIAPKLTDAELLTLAVLQALLGFTSEARFIRHAHAHLQPWFPYLPERPGYNKRLRHAGELMRHVTAHLARSCPSFTDDLWLVDSTPSNAAAAARPSSVPTSPGGPPTATARRTPGSFGGYDSTSSPHRRDSPSRSRSPARRPTNATPPST